MRSQSVPANEHTPPEPQSDRLVFDLPVSIPRKDGRLSWPRWLFTYRDGLSTYRRSPIQVNPTGSRIRNPLITSPAPWPPHQQTTCM